MESRYKIDAILSNKEMASFNAEIQKLFPDLKRDNFKLFLPRLIFECAKYINPAIEKIIIYNLTDFSDYKFHNKHLMIQFSSLFGEENFQKLAVLFNSLDPEFDAYYTDIQTSPRVALNKTALYWLGLNADVLMNCLTRKKLFRSCPPSTQDPDIKHYRKSTASLENGGRVLNHEPMHEFDILLSRKTWLSRKYAPTMEIEKNILLWKKDITLEFCKIHYLSIKYYLEQNFNYFEYELLNKILLIVHDKSMLEIENILAKLSLLDTKCFTSFTIFKIPSESSINADTLNSIVSGQGLYTTHCTVIDDLILTRFISKNCEYREKINLITHLFNELIGKKKFELQTHVNLALEDIIIFITFPKVEFKLFTDNLRKYDCFRENKLAI